MKRISPKLCILVIVAILAVAYGLDFEMFKTLLAWTLGGIIVLLLNVAFFSDLLAAAFKIEEVKDFIRVIREAKDYLKGIFENKKKVADDEETS